MDAIFKIFRFNPEKDSSPHYQDFKVTVDPTDRILDCLNQIKWEQDGTLSFRKSCAHGVCGSDAMKINGENKLACQCLVKDFNTTSFVVEPLEEFPVVKDLVVNMDNFFSKFTRITPYFVSKTPPPINERYQSEEDQLMIEDSVKCILCGSCTSSCPSYWYNKNYLGPSALLKAYRFVFDSRDEAADERLRAVNDSDGAFRCHTIFNCNETCPKEIDITSAIAELKKILFSSKI